MSKGAFYNENDPKAAAWLRELIAAGHIAPGVVDERSIAEIDPDEIRAYTQCHFFAGIGGWSYALRLAGWKDTEKVWTGSCPCQPFSSAGKGKVDKDERHLWPAFREAIAKCRPAICFGEQVASADGRIWLAGIRADLEALGYGVGASDLCAAGVGAPHIRQRLFWLGWMADSETSEWGRMHEKHAGWRTPEAGGSSGNTLRLEHDESDGRQQRRAESSGPSGCGSGGMGDADNARSQRGSVRPWAQHEARGWEDAQRHSAAAGFWSDSELIHCADGKSRRIESSTFPLAHGIPGRVGLLRGYGNAIVPQVAAQFIQASVEALKIITNE